MLVDLAAKGTLVTRHTRHMCHTRHMSHNHMSNNHMSHVSHVTHVTHVTLATHVTCTSAPAKQYLQQHCELIHENGLNVRGGGAPRSVSPLGATRQRGDMSTLGKGVKGEG